MSILRPQTYLDALRKVLKIIGPGVVTGASDDDPSGIGTYAMAGASLGYATLWTAWLTFPLMASIQYTCAKIGMVSGKGIAGVLREHYPRPLLYTIVVALMVANTLNAGADILAIAAGINLLIPFPLWTLIGPIAFTILVVQIAGSYKVIANIFKWLTLSLFTYIGAAFLAKPDWTEVLIQTFTPSLHFDNAFLVILVAILGTTISPYLFFWQANQEVEEEIAEGRTHLSERKGATEAELGNARWDVILGMLLSNVVMYFIILATAATLHQAGRTDINSAADAAEALRPLAGDAATWLMAIGLIGTGFLAVPILTGSAAYAMCEIFGWPCSLDANVRQAKEFYITLSACTLAGLLIDFIGINPMDALLWSAVVNGVLAPPLLMLIIFITNNRSVMGRHVGGVWANVLGWLTTALMAAAVVGLFLTFGKP